MTLTFKLEMLSVSLLVVSGMVPTDSWDDGMATTVARLIGIVFWCTGPARRSSQQPRYLRAYTPASGSNRRSGKGVYVSNLEIQILYGAGILLVLCTAARFLMQELITLVELYKKLRDTIKGGPKPPQLPSG